MYSTPSRFLRDAAAPIRCPPTPCIPSQTPPFNTSYVKDNWVPPIESGRALFERLTRRSTIHTGCGALDSIFQGGYMVQGQHYEVVGETRSGKTVLCHQLAAAAALSEIHVVYIDTCGAFSARRLYQVGWASIVGISSPRMVRTTTE